MDLNTNSIFNADKPMLLQRRISKNISSPSDSNLFVDVLVLCAEMKYLQKRNLFYCPLNI